MQSDIDADQIVGQAKTQADQLLAEVKTDAERLARGRAARGRRPHQAEGLDRLAPGPGAATVRRAAARHGDGGAGEARHRRRGGAAGHAAGRDLRSARARNDAGSVGRRGRPGLA